MSTSESPTVSDKLDPRHKVILGVIMVSTFVVFLNETALGVALPQIMKQLNIQPSTGQWLNTAYMLTMAVIIPTTGFLLQRFSTKPMYIAAMTFFTTGTLVAALSQDFFFLLIGRILQASGTAIMMPLLMTTVMVLVPEHLRGRINGNISLVLSAAPALGPAFSGLVLSFLDWRWLFWIMLPIGVVTLIIGTIRISNSQEPRKIPIDVFSVILSAFAFSGLIYGLSSFADAARGVATMSPWIPLGVGVVFFALFLQRQARLQ
ncbi:MAG: MFS transporter, partial [Actinomycetales bacterium]|nr:MFS transporter [Actinomycetales bacterium]